MCQKLDVQNFGDTFTCCENLIDMKHPKQSVINCKQKYLETPIASPHGT